MEGIGDTDYGNGVAASANETLVDDDGIVTGNRPYGLGDPFPCSCYLKID